ncbi:uncharacterized protein LOC111692357 [Anoplophora glabripennis]|uniref:uncharacterized protein LOC111692357 n=1 Tax=Anoplophora glabripennis TaxID=217634 RepID=UPI000C75E6B9|nr:uncharacterized protein LOC111692357 [Anoplophora glabripennis]
MASTSESEVRENSEREFISLLIELYRDCPELWKVKSKDYFNRNKKSAALEKIVGALKKIKPDFSVIQLKQKINVLRTNFNREFKAIEGKKVSGTSTDDIPEPSLWYYNDMHFIKDQLEIAQTETSEQPTPVLLLDVLAD